MRRCSVLLVLLAGCFGEPPRIGDATSDTTGSQTGEDTTGEDVSSTSGDATSTSTIDPPPAESSETSEISTSTGVEPSESYCSRIVDEYDVVLACRDFDELGGEIGTWHDAMVDGGVLEIGAQQDAPSSPNAMHSYYEVAAGEFLVAEVSTVLGQLTSPHRLRFRMDLGACDGDVLLVNQAFGGAEPFEVGLAMVDGSVHLRVLAMGAVNDHALDPAVLNAAPSWAEWELEVDVLDSTIAVRVEQVPAIELRGVPLPLSGEPPSIRVGVLTGSLAFGCSARYDDIAVIP